VGLEKTSAGRVTLAVAKKSAEKTKRVANKAMHRLENTSAGRAVMSQVTKADVGILSAAAVFPMIGVTPAAILYVGGKIAYRLARDAKRGSKLPAPTGPT
jgi:hypothetical protein